MTEDDFIQIRNPMTLGVDRLPVHRTVLGVPGDEKPSVALMPDGELLLVGFKITRISDTPRQFQVDKTLFRSVDDGVTWSDGQVLDLPGVEPCLTVLKDGTLLVTVHVLAGDVCNSTGYSYSCLHRSTDRGNSWESIRIGPEDIPAAPQDSLVVTSRNVLELADGTVIMGVSGIDGRDFLWRSTDSGRTWDKTAASTFTGIERAKISFPRMGETLFWQNRSGDILGLFRVDAHDFDSIADPETLDGYDPRLGDQHDLLMVFRSRDGGVTWEKGDELGSRYGEMYPSILRLHDGRLLLTFTVRHLRPPLGTHAVLGEETLDGCAFDYANDRLIIDRSTPMGDISGGGFGPTVQLLDGTLLTAYSCRSGEPVVRVDSFLAAEQHIEVARWRLPP
jgi:hypothetical protein